MKKILISILIITTFFAFSCGKEEESARFNMLTSIIWLSDSLIANGEDASGPGELLEKFIGKAIFNKDGSGTFGDYIGTWHFAYDETKIVLASDSLIMPLTTNIEELTNTSLKITTSFPNMLDPENPTAIRLTFKPE